MGKEGLRRRFYASAGVEEREGSYILTLDGKPTRTPARAPLALPTRALADAVAAEWEAQTDHIDPGEMPVTRIVNSAIDGVQGNRDAVIDEIVKYAASDMLCYRAEGPETLVGRQREAWDPILDWARDELGSPLNHVDGIMFVAQPESSLASVRDEVTGYNPFRLAALHVITTLTGSAVLAIAVARGSLEPESAWAAAHLDENFQIERWGGDAEAQARRSARWREMDAAARILTLSAPDT